MGEFHSFMEKGEVSFLKAFPGQNARQLIHHTIHLFEDNTYDVTAIYVDINNLLSNVKSTNEICKGGLKCRNNNIGMIFFDEHNAKLCS